jgi:diacylglycerol kinase (ATP)
MSGSTEAVRRIGVVVNPERAELGDRVISGLRERGCDVVTAQPDDATELASAVRDLVESGVDAVSAIGGDGTQRTVASTLVDLGGSVPLAVVPGGTVNLLAKVLGVDDVGDALDVASGCGTRRLDVGLLDERLFVLNSSTGWDASTIEAVDDGAKRFGRLGYAATALRRWRDEPTHHVTVSVDGRAWFEGDAKTVLVLNAGQRGSSSIQVAPDARLDDGRLDVVVLRQRSVWSLLRTAAAIVFRRDPDEDDLVRAQGESIAVEWECDITAQIDGDDIGRRRRLDYEVRPSALTVAAPS